MIIIHLNTHTHTVVDMCGRNKKGRNFQVGKSSCSIEILPARLKKESNKKKKNFSHAIPYRAIASLSLIFFSLLLNVEFYAFISKKKKLLWLCTIIKKIFNLYIYKGSRQQQQKTKRKEKFFFLFFVAWPRHIAKRQ